MKKIALTLAVALMSTFAFATGGEDGSETLQVQTNKSSISWTGKKVTGQHSGTIDIKGGTVNVERGMIETANITIDMSTIVITDKDMGDDYKAKLKGHLESSDFFNVAEHTTANFQLTSFKPHQGDGGNYMVTGKLTIKGITQEISFPATVTVEDGLVTAMANLTFDRSKFDIRYGSDSFFDNLGDKVIYDDVEISFTLVAKA